MSGLFIPTIPVNVDVAGTFTLSGKVEELSLSGTYNNFNPPGLDGAGVLALRTSGATDVTITGLAGGVEGRILIIYFVESLAGGKIYLTNLDTSSSLGNRFFLQTGLADPWKASPNVMVFQYAGQLWTPVTLTDHASLLNLNTGNPHPQYVIPEVCNGRLTLTSGVAVTTSNVTAATNLYFTPFEGNQIALYDGTKWNYHTFTEMTFSLSGLTADTNYDVFIYDNSGLTGDLVAWTNDTTPSAQTTQDGIVVKSGATGRRHVGSIRITGTTGQCEDSTSKRFVWNRYNRRQRRLQVSDLTAHTYNSATIRSWNADDSLRVHFILGAAEDNFIVTILGQQHNAGRTEVGINTNTAASIFASATGNGTLSVRGGAAGFVTPSARYYFIQIVQAGSATPANFALANLEVLIQG